MLVRKKKKKKNLAYKNVILNYKIQITIACLCFNIFSLQPPTGISSETILKHSEISEEELLDLIYKLNADHRVDGLLVQLPLPGKKRLETWNRRINNEFRG